MLLLLVVFRSGILVTLRWPIGMNICLTLGKCRFDSHNCCTNFVMGGLDCRECELLIGWHTLGGIQSKTGFETQYHDMMMMMI